jgi:hypothetical protein
MSDNSDSDEPAKFKAFKCTRAEIPYSPVLQELRRKGNEECRYRRNQNGKSDSSIYSDASPEPQRKKFVWKKRNIDSLSAGSDYTP